MIKYISQIYVLNLPHRIDRLNFQLNQFEKYNIDNYEIVNPVVVDNANNFLNKAIYSCYLYICSFSLSLPFYIFIIYIFIFEYIYTYFYYI